MSLYADRIAQVADDGDELDDEEREALHRELVASIAETEAESPTFDAAEVLAELGSR